MIVFGAAHLCRILGEFAAYYSQDQVHRSLDMTPSCPAAPARRAAIYRAAEHRWRHSPLMFAALIIGHHRSISAFWNVASPSGVCWSLGKLSWPSAAIRARRSGAAIAAWTAELSFATTSVGAPLGIQRPTHVDRWNPGRPASSTVGMSGAAATLVLPAIA